jgi:cytochrome P450
MVHAYRGFAGPKGRLLGGDHAGFAADRLGFLERTAREHGEVVPLRFGPYRFWLLTDPDLIGGVLTRQAGSFKKALGLERLKVVVGDGLLTSEGETHARRSRIAQPSFRKKAVEGYAGAMVGMAADAARRWCAEGEVDVAAELSQLTLRIAARAFFGSDLFETAPGIADALTSVLEAMDERMEQVLPLPLWVPVPSNRRMSRALGVLDEAVFGMIRERRTSGQSGDDLMGRLLAAPGDDGTAGLSTRELRDEVMTLFLAGHETTANALAFTLRLMAEHPGELQRARREVDEVLGGGPATAADVKQLTHVTACFEESMRLYPPAWMLARRALEDVRVGDRVPVKRGEMVLMPQWVMHRDPRFWPEPLAFQPDRFLKEAPRPRPWTYYPFGGGKRACIGRSFAMLEGPLVLATILQHADLDFDLRRPLELQVQITLRLAGGLPARGTTRSSVVPATP